MNDLPRSEGPLRRLPGAVAYAVLIGAAVFSLLPVLALLVNAMNPGTPWSCTFEGFWPERWDASSFAAVWKDLGGAGAMLNGLAIALVAAAAALPVCTLAAYGLVRKRFVGRRSLYKALIIAASLPPIAYIVVIWRAAAMLGLWDTRLAVALLMMAQPLTILILRSYIRRLPSDMLDAARLDGLSDLGILRRIVLPQIHRGLILAAMLQFLVAWNSLTVPLGLIASPEKQTLTVLAAQLARSAGLARHPFVPWSYAAAAALLSLLPVLVVYLAGHRFALAEAAAWAECRGWDEEEDEPPASSPKKRSRP